MRAGARRNLGTVQVNTPTVTTKGDRVDSWADVFTDWCAVEPLTGREFYGAQQLNAEATTRITFTWRDGVTAKNHRVIVGGQTFDILSAINLEMRNRDLQLMCKELL